MKSIRSGKTFLVFLVVCLALVMLFGQVVMAADSVKLSAEAKTGTTGEEITVNINIEQAEGTEGGQFELVFDPDIIKPVQITRGKFVDDANNNQFMSNLELDDDRLMVIWVTPEADTAASGVVCSIKFELLDDGDSTLVFEDVVMAPADVEVAATHTSGQVTAQDPDVAKQAAIDAADKAIADLPDPEDITLDDKPDVEAARALVVVAKEVHGAEDDDFEDLEKLEGAEDMIAKLEAIKAADDAIAALPTVEDLTLDDKADVVAARALVNKAKNDHGAVDGDFANLNKLVMLENRISELEGLKPTPPTGGTYYMLPFLALMLIAVLLISFRISRLAGRKR